MLIYGIWSLSVGTALLTWAFVDPGTDVIAAIVSGAMIVIGGAILAEIIERK